MRRLSPRYNTPAEQGVKVTLAILERKLRASLVRLTLVMFPKMRAKLRQGIELAKPVNSGCHDMPPKFTGVLAFQSFIGSPNRVRTRRTTREVR
jgi:hypothetical protein